MKKGLDYKQAGVDIAAGSEAVKLIKASVESTYRPEVLSPLGGFAGLFALDIGKYKQPVLVSGTDGVGTKLKAAFEMDLHHTIGIDLVAMCVNDILVVGAEPLFFLDYLAVDKLQPAKVQKIVEGVAAGCKEAGCALLGGEMAEMPGFYHTNEYDLAGFAVGVVEKDELIDGSRIRVGDVVVGLASSGIHSNGFSLVRKILERYNIPFSRYNEELQKTWGEALLEPTRIYVKQVLPLLKQYTVKGMAHITGGGLLENLNRCLPAKTAIKLDIHSWKVPRLFTMLEQLGHVEKREMFRTFNMGIGFAVIMPLVEAEKLLSGENIDGQIIGRVVPGRGEVLCQGL
ncbi:MAG: phosphoribosylformylglycinamidine cyclo-ligase [Bacillota bacterium]